MVVRCGVGDVELNRNTIEEERRYGVDQPIPTRLGFSGGQERRIKPAVVVGLFEAGKGSVSFA